MEILWTTHDGKYGHEAAYALLEQAWRATMDSPMPAVEKTEKGKPYFLGNPIHFSISHTKHLAVCAISNAPMGVDVEEIRPLKDGLYQRVLTPGELQWLECHPDGFFYLWTRKEAYVKLTGLGFDGAPQRVDTTKLPHMDFQSWELEGCILTLCAATSEAVSLQKGAVQKLESNP